MFDVKVGKPKKSYSCWVFKIACINSSETSTGCWEVHRTHPMHSASVFIIQRKYIIVIKKFAAKITAEMPSETWEYLKSVVYVLYKACSLGKTSAVTTQMNTLRNEVKYVPTSIICSSISSSTTSGWKWTQL